jgi:CheY-like chemotaxis protein
MTDRRLLWTDDEGPGRFQYAAHRLQREGWQITWARSVDDAAAHLRETAFTALVLDQMLPLRRDQREGTVWGGCTLYRWLRGREVPAAAPAAIINPDGAPLPANRDIPVAIVSAYKHDDVEASIAEAGGPGNPEWLGKPLDLDAIRAFIARER